MRAAIVSVVLLQTVFVTVSSTDLAPIFKQNSLDAIKGEYIVVFKDHVNLEHILSDVGRTEGLNIRRVYSKVLNGFMANIVDEAALRKVRERPDVLYLEANVVVRSKQAAVTWNQDRVDQRNLPLDSYATYKGTGEGVHAYIIDTGIYPNNVYFEGRASAIYDAFYDTGLDCNGHGTHCSGIVGSDQHGIARKAKLYGVRVLDCQGYGSYDTVISGMDYVARYHLSPAVASMSLGGGTSATLDSAVRSLVAKGISVVVAAGNENQNACYTSPARESKAITVGATDRFDTRASFSNYGQCVDIFAPGVDILSTWIDSIYSTERLDGTSMACPHVAGAASILLGNDQTLTPSQIEKILVNGATSNAISNVGSGSPNKLLYIGTSLDTTPPEDGGGGAGTIHDNIGLFSVLLITMISVGVSIF